MEVEAITKIKKEKRAESRLKSSSKVFEDGDLPIVVTSSAEDAPALNGSSGVGGEDEEARARRERKERKKEKKEGKEEKKDKKMRGTVIRPPTPLLPFNAGASS